MKLALWTPRPQPAAAALAASLRESGELVVVSSDPGLRPQSDLDLYHLVDDPAHGFVYRACLVRAGLLWLESETLHTLVHAETAGRGDPARYVAEARRAHGPRGAFIAEQVLRGLGGALVGLLTMNEAVLQAALGVLTTREAVSRLAVRRLGGRPVLWLPSITDPGAADAVLEQCGRLAPLVASTSAELARRREEDMRPLGRALAELRPFARELGLDALPPGVEPRLAELFEPDRG